MRPRKASGDRPAIHISRIPVSALALSKPRVNRPISSGVAGEMPVQVQSVGFLYSICEVARADATAVGARFVEAAKISINRFRPRGRGYWKTHLSEFFTSFLQGAVSAQIPSRSLS